MNKEILLQELHFKAVKSSGPGGQNVNKVATKVFVYFHILNSKALSDFEKEKLYQKTANRITKEGMLILFCDESRSQHQNKGLVIARLFNLLKNNLKPTKTRRLTKPTRGSLLRKAENKKKHSEKKSLRKKIKF